MKCVPIRPLVVAPQIAKPAAKAQNVRTLAARLRTCRARIAALGESSESGDLATAAGSSAPKGRTPTSAGEFRSQRSTSGTTASAPAAMSKEAPRQPGFWASAAINGRNTNCPAALPAVRMPMTRPRLLANQVLAMVAANTRAMEPVPRPISSPQVSRICQDWFTKTVNADPSPMRHRASEVTFLMPKRSMRAAANGAVKPNKTRLMLTAKERIVVDQPNSSCNGTMSTPGAARKPAAPTSARKATAATIQAGWRRRFLPAGVPVFSGGAPVTSGAVMRGSPFQGKLCRVQWRVGVDGRCV